MANTINEYLAKIGLGGKLPLLIGGAAFAVAAIVVLVIFNKAPEYGVLYTNLSAEDSGAVIDKLKEKRVPYSVDGNAISVPAEKVYETRMELAGEGLPQGGGVGFEIFDKTSFGVTDFVQKVNYKRALQGELARTISQIKEVESARVHLAIPEKGVFLEDEKKARASIILKLKPGKTLSQGQVSAVVHLAANSFENLRPEDVTVVDTQGRMWTKPPAGDDGALQLTASQLEYKRSIEKDLETRVQTMIEKAVGPNKVVARVSAEIDTKRIERTEETYNPDGQVIRSEQKSKETSTGGAMSAGVPGVLSNMPETAQAASAAATPPSSNRQNEVINYEISKVISHVVEPLGAIKRLTVAVLVDGSYETAKDAAGKETRKYNPRTEEEMAKYTEMVKGAVGFSKDRGDEITVVSTPFENEFAEAEPEPRSFMQNIPLHLAPMIIKYGAMTLVTIFAIFFILRPVIKRITEEKAALESIQKNLPAGLQGLPHGGELALEAGSPENVEAAERFKTVVKENPQQVAMVLKTWLKETK